MGKVVRKSEDGTKQSKKVKKKTTKKKASKAKKKAPNARKPGKVPPKTYPDGQGRPTVFSMELFNEICHEIANGTPLTKICRKDEMPAYSTVMSWLWDESREDHKILVEKYERARDMQADFYADELVEIPDSDPFIRDADGNMIQTMFGPAKYSASDIKNKLDARKWIASKLKPKKYGAKITQEHTGSGGEALSFKDDRSKLTKILQNPKAAAALETLSELFEEDEDGGENE